MTPEEAAHLAQRRHLYADAMDFEREREEWQLRRWAPRAYTKVVSFEVPQSPFGRSMVEAVISSQRRLNDYWHDALYTDGMGIRPTPPPPTRRERLRAELARRLYDLALRLDPDLADY